MLVFFALIVGLVVLSYFVGLSMEHKTQKVEPPIAVLKMEGPFYASRLE